MTILAYCIICVHVTIFAYHSIIIMLLGNRKFLSVAALLLLLLAPYQCTLSHNRIHVSPDTHSYCREELDHGTKNIDLCHVNDFNATTTTTGTTTTYNLIQLVNIEDMTPTVLLKNMEQGQPFCVKGVTEGWKAKERWTEEHFRSVFASFELFSSTFATNASPVFGSSPRSDRDVYYGIFVNDNHLAQVLAEDYSYPTFIPQDLKVQGRTIDYVVYNIHGRTNI